MPETFPKKLLVVGDATIDRLNFDKTEEKESMDCPRSRFLEVDAAKWNFGRSGKHYYGGY